MSKALQVVVVFEFAGIESPDSPEADEIVDYVTQMVNLDEQDELLVMGASAAWVQEVVIREGEEV
jgi:hypothetical protein